MNLNNVLWLCEFLAEATLFGFLIYRRAWRAFPLFFAFCAWATLWEIGAYFVIQMAHGLKSPAYATFYFYWTVINSVLEIAVLVELAWAILRPLRSSLPKRTPVFIAVAILLIGVAIWPFAGLHISAGVTASKAAIIHVQQTTAVLRILFFVALTAGSQFLSIGWRDRELQIATGLGFYSFVSLCVAMVHTHQASYGQYRYWQQLVTAGYICTFLYFIFSFSKKDVARREFTPQMQNMLLAMAGVAREQRAALTGLAAGPAKPPKF